VFFWQLPAPIEPQAITSPTKIPMIAITTNNSTNVKTCAFHNSNPLFMWALQNQKTLKPQNSFAELRLMPLGLFFLDTLDRTRCIEPMPC
jgi:hypothetical protein